ncbi:MAG: TonB-dependent receptor [Candidatus Glassbacteria bacterium]|nr:TonB-dependent receptor [Candidatus Glassbacteria bacterium]
MVRLLSIMLLVGCSSLSAAEGFGEIHGIVKSERGERLKGAQVVIQGTKLGAVATAHGHYQITRVPAGQYRVVVQMTGYESRTGDVAIESGRTFELDFILESRVVDLSPVVVTATLTEQGVENVPAAVEVIDEDEINGMGAETVADALKESQSLALQTGSGRALVASLRGLRANHSLILIDGRRVSTGFRNNIDLGEIPNSMIERIEVVRGPTSALYGSDAVGGVINIITRDPSREMTGGFTLRYGQSTYGEAENPLFRGDLSGRKGRLGYSLAGSFNLKNRYDRDLGTAETDGDRKQIGSGTGKISLDLARDHRLLAGLDYSETERDGNRLFGWGDGKREADTQRRSFFLEYRGKPGRHSEVMVRGYNSHFGMDVVVAPLQEGNWNNPLTGTQDPFYLDQDLNQVEGHWSGLFHADHLVTMGAEYRYESRKDNAFDNHVSNGAFFFQDEFQVSGPFLLVFGARYDRHSDFGSEVSPKVSATVALHRNARLKASYGEGFRAPNIFELYVDTDTKQNLIRPNPDLGSETSRSFELGLEGGNETVSGEIRFFRNDLKGMINTVQVGIDTLPGKKPTTRPIFIYQNTEEAMTQGLEVNASLSLPGGFVVSDEAALMSAEDKKTGERLFNKPDFLNTWKLAYSSKRLGLKANLRANTAGGQRVSQTYETRSYTLWNLYAARKLSAHFEVYLGVNNIFNSDPDVYGFTEGARLEGTFYYTGLTAQFR